MFQISCISGSVINSPELASITFSGNSLLTDKILQKSLTVTESSSIPFFGEKFYINEETVREERKRVERVYEANGIYGSEVRSVLLPSDDTSKSTLEFQILEGNQVTIKKLSISGITDEIQNQLELIPEEFLQWQGKSFTEDWYTQNKIRFKDNLVNKGFPYAQLNAVVRIDPAALSAEIDLQVNLGLRYFVEEINVFLQEEPSSASTESKESQNAQATDDQTLEEKIGVDSDMVRRHMSLQIGEPYSEKKALESKEIMLSIGVFNSVEIKIPSSPPEDPELKIQTRLLPGNDQSLKLGFGLSMSTGRQEIRGTVRHVHSNFIGGFRRLESEIKPAYVFIPDFTKAEEKGWEGTASVKLKKPEFLRSIGAKELSGIVGGKVERELQRNFKSDTFAIRPGLVWPERSSSTVETGLNLEIFTLSRVPSELNDCPSFCRLFYWDQMVVLDKRDKPSFTQSGYYLRLSLAETLGLADYQFVQAVPEIKGYYEVLDWLVVAGRVVGGATHSFGHRKVPLMKRFYLGGATSHRGFPTRELSPTAQTSSDTHYTIGGNSQLLVSEEMRFRPWPPFWVIGFFDSGAVEKNATLRVTHTLNHAAGIGFAYDTGVVPVRLDFAYRMNDRPEYQHLGRFAFHLNLGESF